MPSNDITIVGSDNQSGLQTETINVKLTKQITDNECQYIANVNVGRQYNYCNIRHKQHVIK